MRNLKIFTAEFIGTFALVFVGMAAGIVNAGLVGIALAQGFVVATFMYAFGNISGAHLNPAVTFGLALNGTIKWAQTVYYWVAQFVGAVLAAYLLKVFVEVVGATIDPGMTTGALTQPAPVMSLMIEAILTFFLVNAYLHTTAKKPEFAGLAVGLTVAFSLMAGLAFTGASMNPARTFGPAVFVAGNLSDIYTYVIYFFGPLIGSTLAVLVYGFLAGGDEEEMEEGEDEVLTEEEAQA